MSVGKQKHEAAEDRRIQSVEQTRISLAPTWTWRLIICGALLDVASTLLPWGANQLYLPWSLIIGSGTVLHASEFLTVGVLIRAAAMVGWAGVLLHEYVESRMLQYVTILTSSALSFLAVAFFTTTGINLSWGAYLGLAGGAFLLLGVLIERLEVELVVDLEERCQRKTEDDSINEP